jgi:hypothetical protein
MKNEIKIKFGNVEVVAELLIKEAPKSCELIKNLLPLEGKPWHAIENGREIFLPIPEPDPEIIPENQTIHQIPGDVFIYDKPIIYIEPDWPEIRRHRPVIAFSYGRDTQVRGTFQPLAVNIIGRINGDLEQLEDEAVRLRNEGVDFISFTKK